MDQLHRRAISTFGRMGVAERIAKFGTDVQHDIQRQALVSRFQHGFDGEQVFAINKFHHQKILAVVA